MSGKRVRLIHWSATETAERAERIRAAGYVVDAAAFGGGAELRSLRQRPPLAVVIDLTRLPMQGRDVGLAIRHAKATRHVPLVFVEGDREKLERVRRQLPDATYATWRGIRGALARAIAQPPASPAVPVSALAGYSGTPLPKKLGIKAGAVVALVGAPQGFRATLGDLPDGVRLVGRSGTRCDLTLWFLRSRAELERSISRIVAQAARGPVWIAWPKQSSGLATDLTQQPVREAGLAAGLVDYKVCAIDATWSGLLFTRRRSAAC